MVTVISGYFDPLHVGHLEMIEKVLTRGDEILVAVVNNDKQVKLKKGKSFMKEKDRVKIMGRIKGVDIAFLSIDKDRTVNKTLEFIKPDFFVNGGDVEKCLEEETCKKIGCKVLYGFGNKIESSSNLTGIK